MAAEQGHSDAQHNLARMYEDGLGVKQDRELAAFWREKALKEDKLRTSPD
ncbi:MAG: SEL1-like repeat protein [Desulfovibrio sp.]|nr:SEL1-like repeat protein [Desulfovibrio sp.]